MHSSIGKNHLYISCKLAQRRIICCTERQKQPCFLYAHGLVALQLLTASDTVEIDG